MRRLFLRKLKTELKIPVLALVDSDPYGLKILSVYMKGARVMGLVPTCKPETVNCPAAAASRPPVLWRGSFAKTWLRDRMQAAVSWTERETSAPA